MNIFKRHTSELSNENGLNKSFKKFLYSEEKNYEILNNAFSPYSTNYRKDNQPKRRRSKGNTKRKTLRFPLYKAISQDKSEKSKNSINNFLKRVKNPANIKFISKYKSKDIYSTTFNNFTNKLPKLNENKKDLLINKNKINNLSSNILNININYNNINTEKNIIKKRNNFYNELNILKNNNMLNKTGDLFNNFKKSKKILNFIQFYNKNTTKKEIDKESNIINIKSLSFKTTKNMNQDNKNKNKLYYDIKEIKDINSIFKNKIEKSEIKLNLKSKKFKKRCKRNEIKYFENEDLKLMKNKLKKKGKILDFKRYSQKEIIINKPQKIFGNNYKKQMSVSEEIKLRKKKKNIFMILLII